MNEEEIYRASAKRAYFFIERCWLQTHLKPNMEQHSIIRPIYFNGNLKKYKFPFNLFYEEYIAVPMIAEQDFTFSTYEQLLNESPEAILYSNTSSIIKLILNYLNKKKSSLFNRESNTSHPRYLLGIHFCHHFVTLTKAALNNSLLELYHRELSFINLLYREAHLFLPTSNNRNGREGFHAVLLAIEKYINDSIAIISAYLERKSIKEHIDILHAISSNLIYRILTQLPYIFSAIDWDENFVIADYLNKDWKYATLRQSPPGQWLTQLHVMQQHTDLEQLDSNNPWLQQVDTNLIRLKQTAVIASVFKKDEQSLIRYMRLFGLLAELFYLNKLMTTLAYSAGLFGDFSMVFNKTLCRCLNVCLNSWGELTHHLLLDLAALKTVGVNLLIHQPGSHNTWADNHKIWWNFNDSLMELMRSADATVAEIRAAQVRLKKINLTQLKKTIYTLGNKTECWLQRQFRLGIIRAPRLQWHSSAIKKVTIYTNDVRSKTMGKGAQAVTSSSDAPTLDFHDGDLTYVSDDPTKSKAKELLAALSTAIKYYYSEFNNVRDAIDQINKDATKIFRNLSTSKITYGVSENIKRQHGGKYYVLALYLSLYSFTYDLTLPTPPTIIDDEHKAKTADEDTPPEVTKTDFQAFQSYLSEAATLGATRPGMLFSKNYNAFTEVQRAFNDLQETMFPTELPAPSYSADLHAPQNEAKETKGESRFTTFEECKDFLDQNVTSSLLNLEYGNATLQKLRYHAQYVLIAKTQHLKDTEKQNSNSNDAIAYRKGLLLLRFICQIVAEINKSPNDEKSAIQDSLSDLRAKCIPGTDLTVSDHRRFRGFFSLFCCIKRKPSKTEGLLNAIETAVVSPTGSS